MSIGVFEYADHVRDSEFTLMIVDVLTGPFCFQTVPSVRDGLIAGSGDSYANGQRND